MRLLLRRDSRLIGLSLGALLSAATYAAPARADGGSISLADAYGGTTIGTGAIAIGGRNASTPSAPASGNALFTGNADLGGSAVPTPSGTDNATTVRQRGRHTILNVDQLGTGNRLNVTQGDLAMLLVSQTGTQNAIQILQVGQNETATIKQDGSYNGVTGMQTGSGEKATITQSGTRSFVAYTQSGTGSTLTVRQR